MPTMTKVVPFLLYAQKPEETVRFYCSIPGASQIRPVAALCVRPQLLDPAQWVRRRPQPEPDLTVPWAFL